MEDRRKSINFLEKYRDKDTRSLKQFTATQFMEVWRHYDNDGNGYIEGEELNAFLREFVSSIIPGCIGPEVVSDEMLRDTKEELLGAYDENDDQRIEIGEMAELLPLEESFLLLFRRDNPLDSSVEFMRIWKRFDEDNSGYIDGDELKAFLEYMLQENGQTVTPDKLAEYTDTILKLFDKNGDGKLQLSEMARLMPVRTNHLSRPLLKNASKLTKFDIDMVFRKYDTDKNGSIENEELQGFLKDLLEFTGEEYDEKRMQEMTEIILGNWDVDHDGKIGKEELRMILLEQSRTAQEDEVARRAEEMEMLAREAAMN